MAELSKALLRPNNIGSSKFLAGNRAQLPTDHVVACSVITGNSNFIDRGLLPFKNSHLNIDRVALNGNFNMGLSGKTNSRRPCTDR